MYFRSVLLTLLCLGTFHSATAVAEDVREHELSVGVAPVLSLGSPESSFTIRPEIRGRWRWLEYGADGRFGSSVSGGGVVAGASGFLGVSSKLAERWRLAALGCVGWQSYEGVGGERSFELFANDDPGADHVSAFVGGRVQAEFRKRRFVVTPFVGVESDLNRRTVQYTWTNCASGVCEQDAGQPYFQVGVTLGVALL